MKLCKIKEVYDFVINTMYNTTNGNLVFTPQICIIKEPIHFEIFEETTMVGSLYTEDYCINVRYTENNRILLSNKVSKVSIKEFEDFIVINENDSYEYKIFIFGNCNREDINYNKFITMKGL